MQYLLSALVLFCSTAAHAQEKNLDEQKQQLNARLDERIHSLQSAKACIQSATTHEALKACREQEHGRMEALHDKNQELKKEKIDTGIKRLQERRAKMDGGNKNSVKPDVQ